MNENRGSKIQYILSSGAKLGIAQTVLLLLLYLTGTMFKSGLSAISWLIYAAVIYYTLKIYRDRFMDGYITYWKGVGFGTRISMWSGVIVGFFYFLMIKVFDPSMADMMIAEAEEAYLAMGLSETYVESMHDAIQRAANPWVLFFSSILNGLVYGFIVSLIVSIFTKRKGDPFQEAMQDVS